MTGSNASQGNEACGFKSENTAWTVLLAAKGYNVQQSLYDPLWWHII